MGRMAVKRDLKVEWYVGQFCHAVSHGRSR